MTANRYGDPWSGEAYALRATSRRFAVKAVADVIGVARSNLVAQMESRPRQRVGRPPVPAEALVAEIKAVIADLPTYGYRRVHAIVRRTALADGRQPPNHKRVYRVMKEHGLLLQRHAGGAERRHDGTIAVDRSDLRWCSDAFEVACDNGERVRVAFALDCCDREAMSYVATTGGIGGEEVRDLMVTAVEHRFGRVNRLPRTIEWLTDNGSGYVSTQTRRFGATSAWSPGRHPWRALNRMAWPRHSCAPSSATTSGSPPSRMPRASCACCRAGWRTIMRSTPTKPSATVHRASSSPPNQTRDHVRSFGGNNTS